VPLATSLHTLQGQFSRSFNRRWSRSGSLWQSRYHAKLIDEQQYLSQVVLYIHLNPVRAGLTEDPVDYVFSGHREIVKASRDPLVDTDDALLCFGETRRQARRAYFAGIRAGCDPEASTPAAASRWWDLIPRRDDVLEPATDHVSQARHSRSRPPRPAGELVAAACDILSVSLEDLNGPGRSPSIATDRRLIVSALHDRWRLSRRELAIPLGRNPEVISHWLADARTRRDSDEAFARRQANLETHLVARHGEDDGDP